MKQFVLYLDKNDNYVTKNKIEVAFEIMTGKRKEDYPGSYLRFFNNVFLMNGYRVYVPSYEELINDNLKVYAIMKYRYENDCGLAEAKENVEEMFEKKNMVCLSA